MSVKDIFQNDIPCAVCIVGIDKDLTISYANNNFYKMIGISQNEMQLKCANRMSVLLGVTHTKRIRTKINEKQSSTLIIEYEIKTTTGNSIWLHSQIDFSNVETEQSLIIVSFDITRHKLNEVNLRRFEQKSLEIFDLGNFDAYEYDGDTFKLNYVFSKYLFASTPQIGTQFPDYFIEILHPDCVESFNASFKIIQSVKTDFCEVRMKDKTGEYRWFRSSLSKHTHDNKTYILHILSDITAEKEATMNYLHETLFYQAMLSDQAAYGHLDVSLDKVLKMGGLWNLYNEVIDKVSYTELFMEFVNKVVHTDDRERYLEVLSRDTMIDSFEHGVYHLEVEFRRIVEQNKMSWMKFTAHLFKDPISGHIMGLLYIKNISDRKKHLEETKSFVLEYDVLTNTYNKETSKHLISQYLKKMKYNELSTLVLLEIDNLSYNKEFYGDEVANKCIIDVTNILNQTFRKSDIIGRYTENQFIILLKSYDSDANLRVRLERLMKDLSLQINPEIVASLGVALIEKGTDYDVCFRHADIALFAAKYAGSGCYIFYQKEILNEEARLKFEKHQYEINIEKALLSHTKSLLNEDTKIISEFNDLAGELGDMGYLIDPKNYDLLCGNQAFYSRLGVTVDECKGKKCYELLHHRSSPCPFCRKANWSLDKFYLYRNYNMVLNQEFLIKNKLVEWHGLEMLLAFAIDLSNDATVVDSIENETTENNYILNGIHTMQTAPDLNTVFLSALDAICNYFRAENVYIWRYNEKKKGFECYLSWLAKKTGASGHLIDESDEKCISSWLLERKWDRYKVIETPEAMLCDSYDMYQIMKKNNVINQRWVALKEEALCVAIIEIDNISINFQNTTFMESFMSFMLSEFKKREMVENVIYSNSHDTLTDLLNRNSYENFLREYHSDNVESIASVCINLNELKKINDINGVNTGDYFLTKTAEFIKKLFVTDHVYRLNGDEFIIIILNKDIHYVEEKVKQFKKMVHNFDMFTASTGFAWDNIERNLMETINNSIEMMRNNKRQYYLNKDEADDNNYQMAQTQLIQSITNHEFEVWLQPKYDTQEGKFFGAEALIRQRHKELGIIPPSHYIPALENNNLIRYIDLFVFEEVCKLLQKWTETGIECPTISLNFSRKTLLEEDLITHIDELFYKYHIPKDKIEIEVTESSGETGKSALYGAILRLNRAGYRVSLDDFGTSYSNLAILSDVNIDVLKIDKSLIHSLETQIKNRIILKNIIQMCNDLDIQVIAEGVEDEIQKDILTQVGCYLIQGYLYSKPIEISEYEEKYLDKIKN